MYSSAIDVFGASIIEWAGIDEPEDSKRQHARWLAQIVDGFGVPGRRTSEPPWLAAGVTSGPQRLIRDERQNRLAGPSSWLAQAASFDYNGRPLPERTAAVSSSTSCGPLSRSPGWTLCCHRARRASRLACPHSRRRCCAWYGETAQAFAHEVRRYYPFGPVWRLARAASSTSPGTPSQRTSASSSTSTEPTTDRVGQSLGIDPCWVANDHVQTRRGTSATSRKNRHGSIRSEPRDTDRAMVQRSTQERTTRGLLCPASR